MIDWFLGQAFFAFFSQKRGSTSPRANRDCRGESARRRRNVRLKASPAPPATACQHEAREILKSVARPQRGALHEVEEAVRDFPKPQILRYARGISRPVPARVERTREIFARAKSGRGPSSAAHFASSPVESRVTAAVCAFAGTSVALRTSASPNLLNILGSPSASATAKLMSIPSSRLFSRAARQRASHVSSAMEPFSIAFISVYPFRSGRFELDRQRHFNISSAPCNMAAN